MKLLCDVHISYKIVKSLRKHADKVIHVNHILDKWYTTDKAICEYADRNDFIVLTKDKDFRNSHLVHMSPKKLILIALVNISNEDIVKILDKAISFVKEENQKPFFLMELSCNYISFMK